MNKVQTIGYLPDERPQFWKLLLYALQQIVVMFPATILVALITGFHLSTTIFASGLATLCFILITGKKIPLYFGSSFSYLSAIIGLTGGVEFGQLLPDTVISEFSSASWLRALCLYWLALLSGSSAGKRSRRYCRPQ